MKRHNFKGQGASHGNHKKHRAPGSIGACATPARVFKGMKMAGQLGNVRTTTLNLEVVESDPERTCSSCAARSRTVGRSRVRPGRREGGREVSAVTIKTQAGADSGSADLPDAVFGIEPNVAVMHQVVTAQLAAARAGTHSTKTRAEVGGGGRSPGARRAPVAPGRARSDPRSGGAAASPTDPSRGPTGSGRRRR
jgi:hypothetical protein